MFVGRTKKREWLIEWVLLRFGKVVALCDLEEHVMSRLPLGMALALAFLAWPVDAQPEGIVVGSGNFPPMFFISEGGQSVGRDVDLWRLWSLKTGVPVEFRVMHWPEVLPALLADEIDVAAGASYTPDRAERMAFTEPYQELQAYLFLHRDAVYVEELQELAEMRVGVLRGTSVEEYVREHIPEARTYSFLTYESLVTAALGGRVEAFIAEEPLASYHLTMADASNAFRRSSRIFLDASLRMAVRRENEALLALVNEGFDAITDEERRQIDEGWFGPALGPALEPEASLWPGYLWLFLALAIVVALVSVIALANTWYRELPDVQTVRETFVNMWLICGAVAAPPLGALSVLRAPEFGWSNLYVLHIMVVVTVVVSAVCRKHIHYYLRTLLVLALLYVVGLSGLLTYGLAGATQLPLVILVVVATVLFGIRGGTVAIFVGLATIGGVGVAVQMGLWTYTYDVAGYSGALITWATIFALFAFYTIGLVLGVGGVYKHMEGALHAQRRSESLFRNLVETTSDWIWETNAEGRFVYSSPQVKTILGYSPSEIVGQRYDALMPAEERKRTIAAFQEAVNSGRLIFTVENSHQHKDGGLVVFETRGAPVLDRSGEIVGYRGVARDITKRKQAEEERERLMTAIEQAGEAIIITDAGGIIQYVNPAFIAVSGYSREDVIGESLRLLADDVYGHEANKEMWGALADGDTWTGQVDSKRKDGGSFVAKVTISPVHDITGRTINFIAVQQDISTEKELEAQLLQAQKMEALGQITGGVSHDFNNLLQAILGFAELARDDAPKETPLHSAIEEVLGAGNRAATLVRQLLAFSRRQPLEMRIINLNEVVTNMTNMVQRVIGAPVTLGVHPDPTPAMVRADRGQMEQILMNLCVNARDAMPDGGVIDIDTAVMVLDGAFCAQHGWENPGAYVRLRMSDTGRGMDAATLEKIFEPFFTTKEVGKGTGLGLSTVYGLVKQHAGNIQIASSPGEGTTVDIYLPLVDEEEAVLTEPEKTPAPGGVETVLVAEDDSTVRYLCKTVLERAGYNVLTASDGEEAVAVFEQHADEIALLLLDVIMPKLNGIKVLERVRGLKPKARILFCSGYAIEQVHADIVLNACTHALPKPFHPNDLLQKVRTILDGP